MGAIVHRNAEGWLLDPKYRGVKVIDPDGWRGEDCCWEESITEEEFVRRLLRSTCRWPYQKQVSFQVLG